MRLNNKTILITGANRGIGRALADELSKYPVHLLLGMRRPEEFEKMEFVKAPSVKPIKLDLSSAKSISEFVSAHKSDLEKVDILINNAGQYVGGPLADQNIEKIYSMFQVNLVGLIDLTQRLLPTLKKHKGKIVNHASIAGYAFFPNNSTYTATKAGLVGFSESLRRELSGSGVSVLHVVTPGVKTEMMETVEATYRPGHDLNFKKLPPLEWAKQIIKAIEADKEVLNPPGATGIVKKLSRSKKFIDFVSQRIIK